MEESDFITRQHLDSLIPCNDPSTFELLNRYKNPPVEVNLPRPPQQQFMGSFPVAVQGNNDAVMLGHMIGQLQGTLRNQPKSNLDGLSLNVNSDILRWVVLFIFLALLVWVVFTVQKKLRTNPADERLERLEKQIRRLKRNRNKRRKKNPKIIQEDEDDDLLAFDDPFDDPFEDDVEEFDLLED